MPFRESGNHLSRITGVVQVVLVVPVMPRQPAQNQRVQPEKLGPLEKEVPHPVAARHRVPLGKELVYRVDLGPQANLGLAFVGPAKLARVHRHRKSENPPLRHLESHLEHPEAPAPRQGSAD